MKLKKLLIIPLILLTFSFLVSPILGIWSKTEETGAWEIVDHTHWRSTNSDIYSTLKFENAINNLTQWDLLIATMGDTPDAVWWNPFTWVYLKQDVYLGLEGSNGKQFKVQLHWKYWRACGAFWACHSMVFVKEPDKDWDYIDTFFYTNIAAHVCAYRTLGDELGVAIALLRGEGEKAFRVLNYTFNLGASWFENVTLTQDITKSLENAPGWGPGWIEGWKKNEIIETGTSGIEEPTIEQRMTLAEEIGYAIWGVLSGMWESVKRAMPEPIRGFLDSMGVYATFALNILGSMFVALANMAPSMFALYGLYLLALTLTCLHDTTFEPLFNHMVTMYNFLMNLAGRIIQIAQAIWAVIKFW